MTQCPCYQIISTTVPSWCPQLRSRLVRAAFIIRITGHVFNTTELGTSGQQLRSRKTRSGTGWAALKIQARAQIRCPGIKVAMDQKRTGLQLLLLSSLQPGERTWVTAATALGWRTVNPPTEPRRGEGTA